MIKQPDLCKTWFETPQTVFFLYSRTCINKHYVLQLSSKFVFIIFNENGNQQHLKYLFHSCFFLYNFFQTFLQYMYLFSAVIGLKVSSQFHFFTSVIMFRLSSQLSRGMRKPAFWVSELVRHNWAVQSQMMALMA